jgi:phosphoribosylglycinamide formyltransferase 1
MSPPAGIRLVVMLSGRGSNYAALHAASGEAWFNAQIAGVISDRPEAAGLTMARSHGLDSVSIDRRRHATREGFEASLSAAIDGFEPDYIVLAGFMRVLGAAFVQRYAGRMINIHPSLLPAYRGLNTHQRVLEAGDRKHGASVHFVTPTLDGGPVLSQVSIEVGNDDTPDSLADRLLTHEHRLLCASVALLARVPVEVRHEDIVIDSVRLASPLVLGRDLDEHGHRTDSGQPGQ